MNHLIKKCINYVEVIQNKKLHRIDQCKYNVTLSKKDEVK